MWYALVLSEAGQKEQLGPMTREALVDLFRSGIVNDQTSVWREGLTEWAPLAQVPELSSLSLEAIGGDDDDSEDGATLMVDAAAGGFADLISDAPALDANLSEKGSDRGVSSNIDSSDEDEDSMDETVAADSFEAEELLGETVNMPGLEEAPVLLQAPKRMPTPPRAVPQVPQNPLLNQTGFAQPALKPAPISDLITRTAHLKAPDASNFLEVPTISRMGPPSKKSPVKAILIALFALIIVGAAAVVVFQLQSKGDPKPQAAQNAPVVAQVGAQTQLPVAQPLPTQAPLDASVPQVQAVQALPVDAGLPQDAEVVDAEVDAGEEEFADAMVFDAIDVPVAVARQKQNPPREPRPEKPKPAVNKPESELPAALTRDQISKVVKSRAGDLQKCVSLMPEAKGTTINVQVQIKRNGSVGSAQVTTARVRGTPLGKCVEDQVKQYQFEPFRGDPMRVQLPFSL